MKNFLSVLIFFSCSVSYGQLKEGIIKIDSMKCCTEIKGTTNKRELKEEPLIYTATFKVDSISGYQNFIWYIYSSNDRRTWHVVDSGLVTEDANSWYGGYWDTLIKITTPVAYHDMGIGIKTIDSTQASRHKHDLYITYPK